MPSRTQSFDFGHEQTLVTVGFQPGYLRSIPSVRNLEQVDFHPSVNAAGSAGTSLDRKTCKHRQVRDRCAPPALIRALQSASDWALK